MAAVPFASSVVLFADALVRGGSEAEQAAWLPAIVRGERIGAVALAEGPGPLRSAPLETTFSAGRMSGAKIGISDGVATEIIQGDLKEGDQVIVGQNISSDSRPQTRQSPPGFGGPRFGGGGGRR